MSDHAPGNAVGAGDELDRVQGATRDRLAVRQHLHFLHDVHAGERTFGGQERFCILERLARDRPPDLQGGLEIALEHAPGPAVARASLDHGDIGLRQQSQHLGRLLPHVLRPRVAGELNRDAAVERRQTRSKPLLAGDVDDVLADVEGRFRQLRDRGIVRGTIKGHSNLSIRAQDGTSAMMS